MIQFLYGANSYFIAEELKKIERSFAVLDSAGMNLSRLAGADLTYAAFSQSVDAMPFLAEKRLTIIKNFLLENKDADLKDKIFDRLKSIQEKTDIDLVFVEMGEPDKRSKMFKYLSKLATAKEFHVLGGMAISKWIAEKVEANGLSIERMAANELEIALESNLIRISNELDKLSLYVASQNRKTITSADIKELTVYASNPNIFTLVENIAGKNVKSALKTLEEFIANGENEQYLLSMVIYQFRTLLSIAELKDRGYDKNRIAKEAGIHPFVVTKSFAALSRYSFADLIKIYNLLADYDHKSKTGEINASDMMPLLVVKIENW